MFTNLCVQNLLVSLLDFSWLTVLQLKDVSEAVVNLSFTSVVDRIYTDHRRQHLLVKTLWTLLS